MGSKEKTNGSLAMAPRVITIPAANQETARKLRVAAYARVSSNSEDQKHSFTAQNAYFSKLITDNPDWELADIYADQGITGTSMYVNYYTRELMNEGDTPPIGIVLCADKSDAVVKYTLPEDNHQIFASKYFTYLPTEEELKRELRLDEFQKLDE